MTHNPHHLHSAVLDAIRLVLEHYYADERTDLFRQSSEERSPNHIFYALRTLRCVLQDPPAAIDINAVLKSRRQVAILWGTYDVQELRPDLTDDQAWNVLQKCDKYHDCNNGFTWEFIKAVADDFYPAPKDTQEAKPPYKA